MPGATLFIAIVVVNERVSVRELAWVAVLRLTIDRVELFAFWSKPARMPPPGACFWCSE
jgi:hypothetical protein